MRAPSPAPGRSILITSAPMSAISLAAYGAETISPSSTILSPESAPAIPTYHRSFGQHFAERLDLDSLENALALIGIVARELERRRFALHVDDDQAAAAVGERAADHHLAAFGDGPNIRKVTRADRGPERGSVRSVVADDHEQHDVPPAQTRR